MYFKFKLQSVLDLSELFQGDNINKTFLKAEKIKNNKNERITVFYIKYSLKLQKGAESEVINRFVMLHRLYRFEKIINCKVKFT